MSTGFNKPIPTWDVVVGNVGTIYSGTSHYQASRLYTEAVWNSKNNNGRMGGEPVTLFKDGEIHTEYAGTYREDQ